MSAYMRKQIEHILKIKVDGALCICLAEHNFNFKLKDILQCQTIGGLIVSIQLRDGEYYGIHSGSIQAVYYVPEENMEAHIIC